VEQLLEFGLDEHHVSDVVSEDLGHFVVVELELFFFFVHLEAVPVADAACSAFALFGAALADLDFLDVAHLGDLVVVVLALEAGVEDVEDVLQRDGCFCDLRREDDADEVCVLVVGLDDSAFLAGLECAVEFFDDEVERFFDALEALALVDHFDGFSDFFDVFDGGEEDQHVGFLLVLVGAEVSADVVEDHFEVRCGVLDERSFEVGEVRVVDLHVEGGRDCLEQLVVQVFACFGEVLFEELRVQRGRGHDELLLRLGVFEQVAQNREDDHALFLEFVRFVDHEDFEEVQEVLAFLDHLPLELVLQSVASTSLM